MVNPSRIFTTIAWGELSFSQIAAIFGKMCIRDREKGERTKRTHRLCNLGGTIESLAPEVKDLTRNEMTELMVHIYSLSEVQRAVRHMAITHTNQANREKELKADGTISVSYTHLDVYKRQATSCPVWAMPATAFSAQSNKRIQQRPARWRGAVSILLGARDA